MFQTVLGCTYRLDFRKKIEEDMFLGKRRAINERES